MPAEKNRSRALLGFAANKGTPGRIISQVTEHSAVIEPLRHLEKQGWQIEWLAVDKSGSISLEELRHALGVPTHLVSIMWGNNEIGTIQPVAEIAGQCADRGVAFHCDAAQAVGKVAIDLARLPISLLTISAHKFYGPVGVGALFVRDLARRRSIQPLMHGGGQEHGIRPGTLNVPAIVGLGAACQLAKHWMAVWDEHCCSLRSYFESRLLNALPDVNVNGNLDHRLPHISNIALHGTDSEGLLAMLPEIIASNGSACHFADFKPSHVLTALPTSVDVAECSLRFGFTKDTTQAEVDQAAMMIVDAVKEFRANA